MIYILSIFLSLGVAALESFSYKGFVGRHLGIPSSYIYVASIALSIFSTFTFSPRIKNIARHLSMGVMSVYTIMIIAETITYPNFVFSRLHINLLTFHTLIFVLAFHVSFIYTRKFMVAILISLLMYVGSEGMGRTLGSVYRGLSIIACDPFASYESKMSRAYPGFYAAMQHIKDLTPNDSTIYIPPQANPWETEGNGAMVTYFLYPRKVLNGPLVGVPPMDQSTYIVIAKGSWERTGSVEHGWPKVAVSAKHMWRFDTVSNVRIEVSDDYDPKRDTWEWGLIEVDYE